MREGGRRLPSSAPCFPRLRRLQLLKIVGWGIAIIFIIGLLVITGILKLIF